MVPERILCDLYCFRSVLFNFLDWDLNIIPFVRNVSCHVEKHHKLNSAMNATESKAGSMLINMFHERNSILIEIHL